MKNNPADNINLTNINTLFGNKSSSVDIDSTKEEVVEVKLSDLHPFENHPYRVVDDDKMQETVKSVKEHGVLFPGIVRRRAAGGYEIISGHRRKRACELAGLTTMPVFIRDLSDDESVIVMVDTNLQREEILISEKAKAYKMKYEALKHQGKADDKGESLEQIGKKAEESKSTVQRYIKLADLIDEWLDMIDAKKLSVNQGVEIAVLKTEEQKALYDLYKEISVLPSQNQAIEIKKMSQSQCFDIEYIRKMLLELPVKKKNIVFKFKEDNIRKYFDSSYTEKQMMEVMIELLEEWSKKNSTSIHV